jgi:tRNA nucleotidyltransferase (CCA-adding enzyme)
MSTLPADELMPRALALPALRQVLAAAGDAPLYLVGGAVRDLLTGRAPADLDLVLDAPVAQLAERLGGATTHDRFETVTLRIDGGLRVDIARSRRETYREPGALPDVEPAPITEDLLRRDFTVNAIALALTGADAGELTTAPGALADLSAGQLRVLHDRSFSDDPTRLLRLARYRGRLGFQVELHTRALVNGAVSDHALDTISGARAGHELRLLVREDDPVSALTALAELGIDRAIEPRFTIGQRLPDDTVVAGKAVDLLPEDGRLDLLVLATAMRWVPAEDLDELLRHLAFPASERETIRTAAAGATRLAETLRQLTLPSEIATAIGVAGPEQVALAGALGAQPQAQRWFDQLRDVELAIDGGDLRAAGVPEGPALGAGLTAARLALLDGRAEGRERQLELALDYARAYSPDGNRNTMA